MDITEEIYDELKDKYVKNIRHTRRNLLFVSRGQQHYTVLHYAQKIMVRD